MKQFSKIFLISSIILASGGFNSLADDSQTDPMKVLHSLYRFTRSFYPGQTHGPYEGKTAAGQDCRVYFVASVAGDEGEHLWSAGVRVFNPETGRSLASFSSYYHPDRSKVFETEFTEDSAYIYQKENGTAYNDFQTNSYKKLMITRDASGPVSVSIAVRKPYWLRWKEFTCYFQL